MLLNSQVQHHFTMLIDQLMHSEADPWKIICLGDGACQLFLVLQVSLLLVILMFLFSVWEDPWNMAVQSPCLWNYAPSAVREQCLDKLSQGFTCIILVQLYICQSWWSLKGTFAFFLDLDYLLSVCCHRVVVKWTHAVNALSKVQWHEQLVLFNHTDVITDWVLKIRKNKGVSGYMH